jgi:hypothetical protein
MSSNLQKQFIHHPFGFNSVQDTEMLISENRDSLKSLVSFSFQRLNTGKDIFMENLYILKHVIIPVDIYNFYQH